MVNYRNNEKWINSRYSVNNNNSESNITENNGENYYFMVTIFVRDSITVVAKEIKLMDIYKFGVLQKINTLSNKNQINFLYICMSYWFSKWLKNELQIGRKNDNFFENLDSIRVPLIHNIDHFIHLLQLIIVLDYSISSNDTTVLHALYMLIFKMHNYNITYSIQKVNNTALDFKLWQQSFYSKFPKTKYFVSFKKFLKQLISLGGQNII